MNITDPELYLPEEAFRWFGPGDPVPLAHIRQAGAAAVFSSLHQIPYGEAWAREAVRARREEIEAAGLRWSVVESIPVHEDIKTGRGDLARLFENYRASIRAVAAEGVTTVIYNFMPVLDWTRTDLRWTVANGGSCMRFDINDFAAFDIHILQRPGAAADFTNAIADEAARRFEAMDDDQKKQLARNVTMGLPGSTESMTLEDVQAHLDEYGAISREQLRAHFVDFLEEVVPVAEDLGLRLCCHPDDPPFSLLGLPRIMSTEADYKYILEAVDSPANGMTLCSGSLGARPDNDLPGMMERFGPKVHFLHLRNVKRDNDDIAGSFFEAEHLGGDTDMVALIAAILTEERRRKAEGRRDWEIPMRPDHGQDILDDLGRRSQPGYPTIGRMKGLAELRGVMTALEHAEWGLRSN